MDTWPGQQIFGFAILILRKSVLPFLLLSCVPLMLADVTGRWRTGGTQVFVLRQMGDTVTGEIQGRIGEPTYKIVDGTIRGNRIFFFVLHDGENDPEVKANGGLPFHNTAQGTFTEDE